MNRRARRRQQRGRGRRPPARQATRLSVLQRSGLALAGLVLGALGILLLAHPAQHSANRLARVAGFMLIVGFVLILAAAFGRL